MISNRNHSSWLAGPDTRQVHVLRSSNFSLSGLVPKKEIFQMIYNSADGMNLLQDFRALCSIYILLGLAISSIPHSFSTEVIFNYLVSAGLWLGYTAKIGFPHSSFIVWTSLLMSIEHPYFLVGVLGTGQNTKGVGWGLKAVSGQHQTQSNYLLHSRSRWNAKFTRQWFIVTILITGTL